MNRKRIRSSPLSCPPSLWSAVSLRPLSRSRHNCDRCSDSSRKCSELELWFYRVAAAGTKNRTPAQHLFYPT